MDPSRFLPLLPWITLALVQSSIHVHCLDFTGIATANFQKKDPLLVKVHKLTSTKTLLTYSYYSLPYCRPDTIVDYAENIGDVLHGYRIKNSPYVFEMREPQMCQIVCKMTLNGKDVKDLKEKIEDEYRVNMILGVHPLVVPVERLDQDSPTKHQNGFLVGVKGQYSGIKEVKYFIHNHLSFLVKYYKDPRLNLSRIVGFEVKPFSVRHDYDGEWNGTTTRLTTCEPHHANRTGVNSVSPQVVEEKKDIIFTYDVEFNESDTGWVSREDNDYIMVLLSLINTMFVVFLVSTFASFIMRVALHSEDCRMKAREGAQIRSRWNLLRADVFRPPANSDILCIFVGTGVQFFGMAIITMIFATLFGGFHSLSVRLLLPLLACTGLFAGYSAARLYKMFKGREWKSIALRMAFASPSVSFSFLFSLSLISREEVVTTTMFAPVPILLWFGISVPLVFVGSYLGFERPAIEFPQKTEENEIPRPIPEQPWRFTPLVIMTHFGGAFPFAAIYIQLFYVLPLFRVHHLVYIFGFLSFVLLIIVVTCAGAAIIACYIWLRRENYLWWWRSYLTSGTSALCLLLYAAFDFFFMKDEFFSMPVTVFPYFGYIILASVFLFVVTGTIGFLTCLWLTRLIYAFVKSD